VDDVAGADGVVGLHPGLVRLDGALAAVVAAPGADRLEAAFLQLTGPAPRIG
jgi:hypothetical protein